MMKKILIVGMTSNQGGVETFVLNILSKLSEKDSFKFTILDSTNSKIAYLDKFEKLGVKIEKRVYPAGKLAVFRRARMANSILRENNFDIIHIQANNLNTVFWVKAALKNGVKKIIFHSHNSMIGSVSGLKKYILLFLMPIQKNFLKRNQNKIIRLAASEASGKWMFGKNSFLVVPNGVDTDRFKLETSARAKLRDRENIQDRKVLVLVARFSQQKNHKRLLQIFKKLLTNSDKYVLWLVGGGELFSDIRKSVEDDSVLRNSVKFWGMQSNISEILSASDLVVMPSLYEGLPFSIVESQASGLPGVVSSEAFGEEANICNVLEYVSLKASDDKWVEAIEKVSKSEKNDFFMYVKDRNKRNKLVAESKYAIMHEIEIIENIYLA